MKMLMHVVIPEEPFNALVRAGTAGKTLQKILETIKPQAAYFTEEDGHRGAILVVDLKDASGIPALAEPFYLSFKAMCKFRVFMTPEDLARANLDQVAKGW
jgi:hypothetical protein